MHISLCFQRPRGVIKLLHVCCYKKIINNASVVLPPQSLLFSYEKSRQVFYSYIYHNDLPRRPKRFIPQFMPPFFDWLKIDIRCLIHLVMSPQTSKFMLSFSTATNSYFFTTLSFLPSLLMLIRQKVQTAMFPRNYKAHIILSCKQQPYLCQSCLLNAK